MLPTGKKKRRAPSPQPQQAPPIMSGVELPCDWTVNRRPVAAATIASAQASNKDTLVNEEEDEEEATPSIAEDEEQQRRQKKPKVSGTKKKPAAIAAAETGHNNNTDTTTAASHNKKKKADVETEEESERSVAAHPLGPYLLDETAAEPPPDHHGGCALASGRIKALVLKQLRTVDASSSPEEAKKKSLDSESLLSRLPYRKMLSDMFGGSLRGNLRNLSIPYVTRAYEESFMREPMRSNERECANGKQCECMFIDRAQPFVGVEFLLPGEPVPRTPHLCVLCCRAITQQLYYDVMFDKADFPGTIQRFGNIHSQPGEYALDAMLIATPAAPAHIMPLPIVSHQRNRYMVHISGGIKWLRQSRVYFQSTPSCSADGGR